jgi:hypothetical protein
MVAHGGFDGDDFAAQQEFLLRKNFRALLFAVLPRIGGFLTDADEFKIRRNLDHAKFAQSVRMRCAEKTNADFPSCAGRLGTPQARRTCAQRRGGETGCHQELPPIQFVRFHGSGSGLAF